MTVHTWLAFVGASIVPLLIPGPTILLVIGDALAHRGRSAWSTVAGVAAGDTDRDRAEPEEHHSGNLII